ncbi:acyl carrier protein [Streptosporangium canum]|jgi:minimal PKS acyl carrier protein|uniref:Act minimal PKS acyl carrier protein n=2 Tax=Streptosporangium TaxID=2000 RepID=A0A1I3GHG3_9ACTN|nr:MULTISPECIES: acyl carrier protein [Streptosporangium]OUC94804.1 acyl carrier protein [Streptosporangium minutum]SFI22591.1 act minimal PKS acyl carrier protein [Streptosporangium canum]
MAQLGSFTLDDLKEVMRACAGVTESVDLDSDIADVTFEDLGYDSLAVLEMAAKLQNHLGVVIPDDVAEQLPTPRALAEYVNVRLAA